MFSNSHTNIVILTTLYRGGNANAINMTYRSDMHDGSYILLGDHAILENTD